MPDLILYPVVQVNGFRFPAVLQQIVGSDGYPVNFDIIGERGNAFEMNGIVAGFRVGDDRGPVTDFKEVPDDKIFSAAERGADFA